MTARIRTRTPEETTDARDVKVDVAVDLGRLDDDGGGQVDDDVRRERPIAGAREPGPVTRFGLLAFNMPSALRVLGRTDAAVTGKLRKSVTTRALSAWRFGTKRVARAGEN